jgi:hypothetical protein
MSNGVELGIARCPGSRHCEERSDEAIQCRGIINSLPAGVPEGCLAAGLAPRLFHRLWVRRGHVVIRRRMSHQSQQLISQY